MRFSGNTLELLTTPKGETPEEIRRAWIGVVIPEVIPTKERQKFFTFTVEQTVAIEALKEENLAAYKWWEERGYPKEGEFFRFTFNMITQEVLFEIVKK